MATRVCETCETEFEHRKRKPYCSRACDPKRRKICEECGEKFVDETRTNLRTYCSDECNPATRKSRDKTCGYCGEDFRDDSPQNSMSYCDPTCRRKARVIRVAEANDEAPPEFLDEQIYGCPICAEAFIPSSSNHKFCSKECRDLSYVNKRYAGVPVDLSREVVCLECGDSFHGCLPHGGNSGNHF